MVFLTLEGRPSSGWLNHRAIKLGSSPVSPSTSNEKRAGIPFACRNATARVKPRILSLPFSASEKVVIAFSLYNLRTAWTRWRRGAVPISSSLLSSRQELKKWRSFLRSWSSIEPEDALEDSSMDLMISLFSFPKPSNCPILLWSADRECDLSHPPSVTRQQWDLVQKPHATYWRSRRSSRMGLE